MQKWEHKALYYKVDRGGSTLYDDGAKVSGNPLTAIKALGLQGWEIVTMTAAPFYSETTHHSPSSSPTTYYQEYYYWLKRPI